MFFFVSQENHIIFVWYLQTIKNKHTSKMTTTEKTIVYVYFNTYGNHNHRVLVIQVGGELGDTVRNSHKMIDPHAKDSETQLEEILKPYLSNEAYEVKRIGVLSK